MDNSIWDKLTMILIVSKMQSTALKNISPTSANAKDRRKKLEALLEKSKADLRMLKGVEDVCIIDSFVVDKANFLSAYKISEESGKLFTFNEFFQTEGDHPGTVYETEIGNKIYYSEKEKEEIWIYSPKINY